MHRLHPSARVLFFLIGGDGKDRIAAVRDHMTQRHRAETKQNREYNIGQGAAPLPGPQQVEGLQAEGREGRKAAAQTDHHEQADVLGSFESAAGKGKRPEEANDETSDHVDEDGSPWESRVAVVQSEPCKRIAQY